MSTEIYILYIPYFLPNPNAFHINNETKGFRYSSLSPLHLFHHPRQMPAAMSDTGDHGLTAALLSPSKKPTNERLSIDDMLHRYTGEFGSWQLRHFVLTSLAWALEAFHTMVMIFADRELAWICAPGQAGASCSHSTQMSLCGLEPTSWEWVGGSGSSTVSEWGLICDNKYLVGLVQSTFFAGCMVGAGVFGHLSDSFLGRKGSLTVVCIMNAITGSLTAFSPTYQAYIALRFLTGFSTGGVGLCAFVLATEPVGPSKRGAVGMSTFYFFSSGIAILSGIAYMFRSWRVLYFASSIPSILFLVAVIPFISESPRWYLIRGKINKAMNVMRSIAQHNGKHLPDGVMLALDEDINDKTSNGLHNKESTTGVLLVLDEDINEKTSNVLHDKESTAEAATGSLFDVIRSPVTRMRLFLTVAINFLCSVVYYGLSLNVVNLKTNLYLSVFLNAVAEMPAFILTAILLDRFGRKPLAIGTLWFSGLFCLVGSVVGNHGVWRVVRMVCGVLGIFGMAGTYNLLFMYTAELFPTVVRNAALGCASQAAQMGAIFAPLVVVMGGGLPFAVFGVCGILGGLFAFYLPETMNQPLYDTMAGLEDGANNVCRRA